MAWACGPRVSFPGISSLYNKTSQRIGHVRSRSVWPLKVIDMCLIQTQPKWIFNKSPPCVVCLSRETHGPFGFLPMKFEGLSLFRTIARLVRNVREYFDVAKKEFKGLN